MAGSSGAQAAQRAEVLGEAAELGDAQAVHPLREVRERGRAAPLDDDRGRPT